jgi:hypothetical protein
MRDRFFAQIELPRGFVLNSTYHLTLHNAGHSDIRTTELYFVRKGEDAELAARRIQIRVTGRKEC